MRPPAGSRRQPRRSLIARVPRQYSRPAPAAMNSTPSRIARAPAARRRAAIVAHDHHDADDHEHDEPTMIGGARRGGRRAERASRWQTAVRRHRALGARSGPRAGRRSAMITRHGRSASTVSSVWPKSDPARRGRQRHHDRARVHLARLVDDQPAGLAGADLLEWPVTRRPPCELGLLDDRLRGALLLGQVGVDRRGVRAR